MKNYISVIVLILLLSCSAGYHETKAHIIERRVLDENNILIRYSFQAGGVTIIDSVRTENTVIPHDSLTVNYSVSDPRKNTLKFR